MGRVSAVALLATIAGHALLIMSFNEISGEPISLLLGYLCFSAASGIGVGASLAADREG